MSTNAGWSTELPASPRTDQEADFGILIWGRRMSSGGSISPVRSQPVTYNGDLENNMQQVKGLQCLDELIADLGGSNDAGRRSRSPCDLLLEHLQAARRNLLGSMPREYSLSLMQAKESVACILNKSARTKVKKILRTLIDSEVPPLALGMWYPARFRSLLRFEPASPTWVA